MTSNDSTSILDSRLGRFASEEVAIAVRDREEPVRQLSARHRVAIVTGIPAPYREPVFQLLARRPNVDLRVFYCAAAHADVAWEPTGIDASGVERTVLANWSPDQLRRKTLVGYFNPAILSELRRFAPTYVIVYGYNQLTHWLTFGYCARQGIPFALRSDSNHLIDTSTSWRSSLRRRLLRWLVARAAAVLPIGSANLAIWRSYGALDRQIFPAPFAVDNHRVAELAGRRANDVRPPSSDTAVSGVRAGVVSVPTDNATTGQGDMLRILYVGRLLPRKGVDLLVEAFNQLCAHRNATLRIVGEGSDLARLQQMQSPAARQRTKWVGKVTNDQALRQYAQADVLVLPSRYEPWGLVVNEAMAAGLPVIAHHRCGAAIDLIEPGCTGLLLNELSATAIVTALDRCAEDLVSLRCMGRAAQKRVQEWSFDRTVDGFMAAITAGQKQATTKASRVGRTVLRNVSLFANCLPLER